MRRAILLVLIPAIACGPRAAEVRTAPVSDASTAALPALEVTNGLAQAVNVYVTTSGTDMFIRQVAGSSSLRLPVQGIAAGTVVALKAVTADNSRTFTRANVTLTGTVVFTLP